MAIATISRRIGRTSRPQEVAALENRPPSWLRNFLQSDAFLDVIVLTSVLMFLVLAAGVGVLALQATVLH